MKLRILVLFILAVAGADASMAGPIDLALGKMVTGSPYYDQGSEVFPLSNVVDGATGDTGSPYNWSFWLAAQGTLGNFTVDLGQVDVVTGIALQDTHNRGYYDRGTQNFTVGLSTDDVHFTTVWTGAFTQSDWENLNTISQSISPTAAQYVQFNADTLWGGSSGGLNEIYVYGNAQAVPEPSSLIVWSLLGSVGLGFGWWRKRKTA